MDKETERSGWGPAHQPSEAPEGTVGSLRVGPKAGQGGGGLGAHGSTADGGGETD